MHTHTQKRSSAELSKCIKMHRVVEEKREKGWGEGGGRTRAHETERGGWSGLNFVDCKDGIIIKFSDHACGECDGINKIK